MSNRWCSVKSTWISCTILQSSRWPVIGNMCVNKHNPVGVLLSSICISYFYNELFAMIADYTVKRVYYILVYTFRNRCSQWLGFIFMPAHPTVWTDCFRVYSTVDLSIMFKTCLLHLVCLEFGMPTNVLFCLQEILVWSGLYCWMSHMCLYLSGWPFDCLKTDQLIHKRFVAHCLF